MLQGLFIGVMTGTSADGLDVSLCKISSEEFHIIDHASLDFTSETKDQIRALCQTGDDEIFRSKQLGVQISLLTAELINKILKQNKLSPSDILAVGFHGQTVRHQPTGKFAFSYQIGCGSTLAHLTKIKIITDFRMADIAAGGQGAPLVPAFHQHIFSSSSESRFILNIGGIANITCIPQNNEKSITGFDTGPGNTLLDEWIFQHLQKRFDFDGNWAKSGTLNDELIKLMLDDEYIQRKAPKSTGKERFNLTWLNNLISHVDQDTPANIQRTLLEFTIESICLAIEQYAKYINANKYTVYVCGGGAKNTFLMKRLSSRMANCLIKSTLELGVDPQVVEASAFAWLAYRTVNELPGNLISVTGAKQEKILGCMYFP